MKRASSLALCFALAAGAAHAARAEGRAVLRIGSKRFPESYVLAEAVRHLAGAAGEATVLHREGLGATAIVFRALEAGEIDLYPEYTGTLREAILHLPPTASDEDLRNALLERGLTLSPPLGFSNGYALALGPEVARARRLAKLSDLRGLAELKLGITPELLGRGDGYPGLAARYGLTLRPQAMDHALAYEAIARGLLDGTDVYTTDAKIARYRLVVLEDDLRYFPRYDAVLVQRRGLEDRFPKSMAAIAGLYGRIDEAAMIAANARVELEGVSFADAGRELALRARSGEAALAPAPRERSARPTLLGATAQVIATEGPRHLGLVALAVFLATLLGVPLGLLAAHRPAVGRFVFALTSIAQTIPSLALLCFFVPLLGTGALPALLALFVYGLLPIARGTATGIDEIPPQLREAAEALGLSAWARLTRVELPLAARSILAGIQTSAIVGVGTATLAAFIGAGGFGNAISTGLSLNDNTIILSGALPAAGLALLVQAGFGLLHPLLVSKGLRDR